MKIKTIFIIILISVIQSTAYSQFIDNKLNIYFSAGLCNTTGDLNINEDNYITPSLYANYEKSNNVVLKATYKLYPYLSLALKYKNVKFSNWYYSKKDTLYTNSNSKIILFAPVIQFHTKFKKRGIFNRAKFYAEFSPFIGKSKLELANPVFDIQTNTDTIAVTESNDFIWGTEISAGIDFTISRNIGVFADFSYNYNKINSDFYNDTKFSYTSINLGLYIRFFKNKHFYY